jgi:hypothetical protein
MLISKMAVEDKHECAVPHHICPLKSEICQKRQQTYKKHSQKCHHKSPNYPLGTVRIGVIPPIPSMSILH